MARWCSQSHSGLLLFFWDLQGLTCVWTLYGLQGLQRLHFVRLFNFFRNWRESDGVRGRALRALKFDAGCRPRAKVAMKRSLWPQPKNSVSPSLQVSSTRFYGFIIFYSQNSPSLFHFVSCALLQRTRLRHTNFPAKSTSISPIREVDTEHQHSHWRPDWKSDMSDMIWHDLTCWRSRHMSPHVDTTDTTDARPLWRNSMAARPQAHIQVSPKGCGNFAGKAIHALGSHNAAWDLLRGLSFKLLLYILAEPKEVSNSSHSEGSYSDQS